MIIKISKGKQYPLFIFTFLTTLALSTVLANVTAMILISTMIITICKGLDHDPTPLLLSAVLATDVAGMATLVSSLPAILVGSVAGIGFLDYILVSLPFVLISIPICIFYLKKVFPPEDIILGQELSEISPETILTLDPWVVIEDKKAFYLAGFSILVTMIGFVLAQPLQVPIGVIAILGGILAIVLTNADERRVLSRLNWEMLLLFSGLFILIGCLEQTTVLEVIAGWLIDISNENLFFTSFLIFLMVGFFSGLLDNIPVTAALVPVIEVINQTYVITNPAYLWYVLIFAGSLGGGWTPFGSAAGILVISILAKENRPLSFKRFIKVFLPISVFLLILSAFYLSLLAILGFI